MRIRRPNLPIVLVTGATTRDDLSEALARGADGFVAKPFTHTELELALARALDRAGRSERDLRERLLAPTLTSALANAIEAREEGMLGHAERLTRLAMRLAAEVGLGEKEIETIRLGALLHDVGKIGIPDSVLLKPSALTAEERLLMRAHTEIGDHLLEPLELLAAVRPIVRHHHERWDGLGYPDRLAGSAIPLGARIMSVADAVDAMSASRVYRAALPQAEIVHELERGRGHAVGSCDRRPRPADSSSPARSASPGTGSSIAESPPGAARPALPRAEGAPAIAAGTSGRPRSEPRIPLPRRGRPSRARRSRVGLPREPGIRGRRPAPATAWPRSPTSRRRSPTSRSSTTGCRTSRASSSSSRSGKPRRTR